jgi:hypothetical protein
VKGEKQKCPAPQFGGLAGWLMKRWRKPQPGRPRLELLDRITLAPRQSLALVEAEGRRILVATSAEGAPAFFSLQEKNGAGEPANFGLPGSARGTIRAARVSW